MFTRPENMSTARSKVALQVAVVTGAGQGIGKAIAIRLANDGFDIVINDLPSKSSEVEGVADLVKAVPGRRALAILGDASDEADVSSLIERTVVELGGIHVFVANAGIYQAKSILDTSLADWERMMAINARSVFLAYKLAATVMIKQGTGGRIIGASSLDGKQGSGNAPAYSASKFAIRGLTQAVGSELARYNITVNAYAPGFIQTPMRAAAVKEITDAGTPEDIAQLVSFWASPQSAFITGQTWIVDGGTMFD
ncbi:NAD-binding protein [Hymenopellis radicata]|nr:NAD-binding protein [Hymenopellis radicata]